MIYLEHDCVNRVILKEVTRSGSLLVLDVVRAICVLHCLKVVDRHAKVAKEHVAERFKPAHHLVLHLIKLLLL